mgnify:CR=1 FL=1
MKIVVKDISPQPDGSHDYLLNMSGVGAEISKLTMDTRNALADGKISVEEAIMILGDTVLKPDIAQKLMAVVYLARMFGVIK